MIPRLSYEEAAEIVAERVREDGDIPIRTVASETGLSLDVVLKIARGVRENKTIRVSITSRNNLTVGDIIDTFGSLDRDTPLLVDFAKNGDVTHTIEL